MMENGGKLIILGKCWDEETREEMYYLQGNRDRCRGILIFGHEFDLTLRKDLSFESAWSIDCGECSSYRTEAEFEASYPGVMESVRSAAADGTLMVREYVWDGTRNIPRDVPYKPLS